jgi:hypothetical protein
VSTAANTLSLCANGVLSALLPDEELLLEELDDEEELLELELLLPVLLLELELELLELEPVSSPLSPHAASAAAIATMEQLWRTF